MIDSRMAAMKVIAVPVVSIYMNSLFIILVPEVYTSLMTLIPILLLTVPLVLLLSLFNFPHMNSI